MSAIPPPATRDSVLFVTLDSCRYDTFAAADLPHMKGVGPLHCAQAPSYFTYGSHAAMFVGFTPGVGGLPRAFLNPKFAKVFKLSHAGFSVEEPAYALDGPTVVEGFRRLGFLTVGTGAVGWFDPDTDAGQALIRPFDRFRYIDTGRGGIEAQVAFVGEQLDGCVGDAFVFINAGETHVPYYHNGAPWDPDDNPCVPFQEQDRAAECRARQAACCAFVDAALAPLIERFRGSTILITSDHGDCWGEDGLWEHGVSHPATLTVPLVLRIRGEPVAA